MPITKTYCNRTSMNGKGTVPIRTIISNILSSAVDESVTIWSST